MISLDFIEFERPKNCNSKKKKYKHIEKTIDNIIDWEINKWFTYDKIKVLSFLSMLLFNINRIIKEIKKENKKSLEFVKEYYKKLDKK